MSALQVLLGRALKNLSKVTESYWKELGFADVLSQWLHFDASKQLVPIDVQAPQELWEITVELQRMSKLVDNAVREYAALVHPNERTKTENQLARGYERQLFPFKQFPYSRKDSPKIDHVFVSQVAACLQGHGGWGNRLSRKASFFKEVFQAAFGEFKEEESIAKFLQRSELQEEKVFFVKPDLLVAYRTKPQPTVSVPAELVLLPVVMGDETTSTESGSTIRNSSFPMRVARTRTR
jgi:hypothetical protein